MSAYPNLFKHKYPELKGIDWVRQLSPEDLAVFIQIGMQAWNYGKLGGRVRSQTARRDERGRFATSEPSVDS